MKSEKEKMLSGELYTASDAELTRLRENARHIFRKYNTNPKKELLEKLFQKKFKKITIEPPFYCDYGINIELGENIYMNFNCTILDCAKVKIGDNTLLAPNVQIYTATHTLDYQTRIEELEYAKPITIGRNCWLGGGVIVLPGVEIGDNSVIGAGSVVAKSIPPNSLAVGNPCKVIKKI